MSTSLPHTVGAVAGPSAVQAVPIVRAGPLRQSLERIYLRLFNSLGRSEYYALGLHRSNLSWQEKKEFAGKAWYLSTIDRVNPPEYRIAAWNKVLAAGVLQAFSIPSPRVFGTTSPDNGTSCDGRPLRNGRDLGALIERFGLERLCFKLVGGWSGCGFLLVTFSRRDDNATTVRVDGVARDYTLDKFWDTYIAAPDAAGGSERQRAFGYLCQEAVVQHPALAALHRESLNTIRVWMAQRRPGRWEMYAAVLRMGTGEAIVDNGATGGIGAPIDIDTGRLGLAVRRGRVGVEFCEYRHHPTTGALIEGMDMPLWSDVLELCLSACSAFPFLRFMGLDVAVTADGATVVEVEADPHQSHQAHLGRGLRPLMIELARPRDSMLLR